MLSFCVAMFTAYLLLSCRRVAVNALRDVAATLHGGVHYAETSLDICRISVRAPDICVDIVQSMILMVDVVQDEVAC